MGKRNTARDVTGGILSLGLAGLYIWFLSSFRPSGIYFLMAGAVFLICQYIVFSVFALGKPGHGLGVLLIFLAVATAVLFVGKWWWWPEGISSFAPELDAQFTRTLVVVAVAFIGAQVALGYVVMRYGSRGKERAVYSHGNTKLEVTWTLITAVIFIGTAILGQRVWAQLHLNEAPEGAEKIEVVAQQFQWNFHYSGADKTFGRTEARFINDSSLNYVGLDPADAQGNDDTQVSTLAIPVDRPVELTLKSKDVIHSFFAPALRFKQDAVPGLNIKVHFTAQKVGKYEVTCAELCGQLHYNMKTFMLVLPQNQYEELAAMKEEAFKERLGELLKEYKLPEEQKRANEEQTQTN
ncbi:MAG TPA: cytochrome c oxidase subunit II [Blastocatellia bacterium]|nr:cytochrome c oxidase subunit II [Blastocatellia bacterium]